MLAVSDDYEKMSFMSYENAAIVNQIIINSNQLLEFEIQSIEGKTVSQITGGGTAVIVASGLAFGSIGALVGATTAKRESSKSGSTKANLVFVHTGGKFPHFTIKIESESPSALGPVDNSHW